MFGNPYYTQQPRFQPMTNQQMMTPSLPQTYIPPLPQPTNQVGLLGKSVDSVEVVKAMDIPLDGTVSYFPLTDGSAIVTKQLMTDGTSKTVVFRPAEEEKKDTPKYVTLEEFEKALEEIDLSELQDIKDDIKELKRQLNKKNKEDWLWTIQ